MVNRQKETASWLSRLLLAALILLSSVLATTWLLSANSLEGQEDKLSAKLRNWLATSGSSSDSARQAESDIAELPQKGVNTADLSELEAAKSSTKQGSLRELEIDEPKLQALEESEQSEPYCQEGMIHIEWESCASPPCKEQHLRCIDRFPYPNLQGVRPAVMVGKRMMAQACKAEGKELCSLSEWRVACQGTAAENCEHGRARRPAYLNAGNPIEAYESSLLQGYPAPSGSYASCRSERGFYDALGGVRELVLFGDEAVIVGSSFADEARDCAYYRPSSSAGTALPDLGFRCCTGPLATSRPSKKIEK